MVQQLPAIVVIAPLVISLVIFIAGWRHPRLAFPMAMVALTICLLSSFSILYSVVENGTITYWLGGWQPPWGIEYRVDHFNAFILCLVSCLGFVSAVYAKKSVAKELPGKISLFWCLYLLLITGLLGIAITGDMFNLFVLLEVASLSGYALVAMGKKNAAVASFRYLIIGTIGASFLSFGYRVFVHQHWYAEYGRPAATPAFFVCLPGGKNGLCVYFHRICHQDCPVSVSCLATGCLHIRTLGRECDYLHSSGKNVYLCLDTHCLFRIYHGFYKDSFYRSFEIICWMAAIAMLTGSIFAIQQDNLKRMLAYSSVANVGYIVLAIGLAPSTSLGLTPAVMHIFNHAIIKGSMFMAACAFIYKLDLWDIRKFVGLGRQMPYSCLVLILAALP